MCRITKISNPGIQLICHFESFQAEAYKCPAGVWTIGYGSTRYADGHRVQAGERITEPEALRLFSATLGVYEQAVDRITRDDIQQHQFDALVSLCYNIGEPNLKKSSIVRSVNAYEQNQAVIAELFGRWNKAKNRSGQFVELPGLTRRRRSEARLYNTGQLNFS